MKYFKDCAIKNNRNSKLILSKLLSTKGFYVLILFVAMVKQLNANESRSHMDIEGLKKSISGAKIGYRIPDKDYEKYLQFYSVGCKELKNFYGFLNTSGFEVFCQVFVPENPKAVVILAHGYLDHSCGMRNLISRLTDEGYAAALFDLPGHGLSSGKRGYIRNFSEYVSVLNDFYGLVENNFEGKIHMAGHSTGCSVIYDFINSKGLNRNREGNVVFISPLVRSYMYGFSKSGFMITRFFVKGFERDFSKGPSNDKEYCSFIENEDPLQLRFIPNGWLGAMFNWNNRVRHFNKLDEKVLLLQGEEDRVVDFRFNIEFLSGKLDLDVIKFKDGRHHLLNETNEIKNKVMDEIVLNLGKESENREL